MAELLDKAHDRLIEFVTYVTVLLEWFSHSSDIRPSEPASSSEQLLPMLEDDGAAYVEDPDFFYDEYGWEGNNDML